MWGVGKAQTPHIRLSFSCLGVFQCTYSENQPLAGIIFYFA